MMTLPSGSLVVADQSGAEIARTVSSSTRLQSMQQIWTVQRFMALINSHCRAPAGTG